MRGRLGIAIVTSIGALAIARPAEARVDIHVDLASQTMEVVSSEGTYVWPISSARAGYRTPHGTFGIQRMEAMHRSHKYHNSPMPHSLFFSGGYAIHGTYATGALGRPASHGCIRIAPENAAALYQMVAAEGGHISIGGAAPSTTRYADREDASDLPHHRFRLAGRHPRRDNGYALRNTDGYPNGALGYAPASTPSIRTWLEDPTGD